MQFERRLQNTEMCFRECNNASRRTARFTTQIYTTLAVKITALQALDLVIHCGILSIVKVRKVFEIALEKKKTQQST